MCRIIGGKHRMTNAQTNKGTYKGKRKVSLLRAAQ